MPSLLHSNKVASACLNCGPATALNEQVSRRKGRAMKLTSAQVERTLSQFEAQAIPEGHPMVEQLSELFGEHTFFLDGNGLNILEPEMPGDTPASAQVINIADWGDEELGSLAPHEPQPTEVTIVLVLH
jgi:hypothetical protein